MTDETTNTDHTETIRRARERMGQYTPGRWYQGTSGYPPNGHISYIAQTGEAWRGSIISGDYSEEVNSAPWLHIPNPADRDLITDAPNLNAALVALADERDALRARVAELEKQSEQKPIVEIAPVTYDGKIQCYRYRVLAYTKAPYAFGFGRDYTEAAQRADDAIEHFKRFGWDEAQP